METCVLSLLLAFLCHGVTTFLCDYACDSSVQRDTYSQGSVLSSSSGLGLSMCERKCRNITGSVSYNYFRPDGKCECVGVKDTISPQALESRKGWLHGIVNGNMTEGTCMCSDGWPCILDPPDVILCPRRCPLPAALGDADLHIVSNTSAFYTCHADFSFFGSSNSVSCTENSTWTGLDGSCLKTAWHNVTVTGATGWVQPIPAPVSPGWKVKVHFKLLNATRGSVNLKRGGFFAVHMDMRIAYSTDKNLTVMASSFPGGNQPEIRLPNAPWKVDTWFDVTYVINAADDTCLIYVDDVFYANYSCYGSCGDVTDVALYDAIFAMEVRMFYP